MSHHNPSPSYAWGRLPQYPLKGGQLGSEWVWEFWTNKKSFASTGSGFYCNIPVQYCWYYWHTYCSMQYTCSVLLVLLTYILLYTCSVLLVLLTYILLYTCSVLLVLLTYIHMICVPPECILLWVCRQDATCCKREQSTHEASFHLDTNVQRNAELSLLFVLRAAMCCQLLQYTLTHREHWVVSFSSW